MTAERENGGPVDDRQAPDQPVTDNVAYPQLGGCVRVVIRSWTMPEIDRLDVVLGTEPDAMGTVVYRVLDRSAGRGVDGTWEWRLWSLADKPTVPVRSPEFVAILDRLVLEHPVLGRIADQFGYDRSGTERAWVDRTANRLEA